MEAGKDRIISRDDLIKAVKAVAYHFNANEIVVVGSQALLVGREDIDKSLRDSQEIDLYPTNARQWQSDKNNRAEASEEINALFGIFSPFHKEFGFYIDGVDEKTAHLPNDWRSREQRLRVRLDDREIEVIAPSPADLVAAKLYRGDPKDIKFASICLRSGLTQHDQVKRILEVIMPEDMLQNALGRLKRAALSQSQAGRGQGFDIS